MTAQLSLTPGLHKERLNHIRASYEASKQGHAFIGHPSYDEQIGIIDALLAGMDSEPVAWRVSAGPDGITPTHLTSEQDYADRCIEWGRVIEPLYTAPPAPVAVPAALTEGYHPAYLAGWNSCRAAMLKNGTFTNEGTMQAEPVTAATWIAEAKKMAEMYGTSFVVFRNGEEPQCADPRKVVISFTDEGLGYPAAPVTAATVPDGWKLVPVEPTERMVIDGFESEPDETFSEPEVWEAYQAMSGCRQAAHRARLCYAAMLAAVPAAPEQEAK
ncbi:hypothetical protein [Kosakonia sacchari]|uniref:hypothetical protein n=1 Tax=Kosakonia sacchari TaxID=1158459 RepID=UPI0015858FD3|nr:hypothetical protein [Kosakonia sacchari]NUL36611.1 hypothetical protein [Kosakonia sacchari]